MFENNFKLCELSPSNWIELRDKFKVDWPHHIVAYSFLNNFIKRYEKNADETIRNIKIFTLDDSWRENATFIGVINKRENVVATLDSSFDSLRQLYRLLDYTRPTFFLCLRDIYHSILHEMIKEKNLKILFDTGTLMRYMSKEQALKMNVNIPKNYKIGNLSEQWLEKINSVWPHRGDESTEYLGYLMKHNVSVGIFDENGELAAWCLQNDTQSLAALQTDENHSRKGLAVAAVQLICKKIAEENDVDIHTNIVHTNIPSMKLFEKLGFENIQDNFWISIQEQK